MTIRLRDVGDRWECHPTRDLLARKVTWLDGCRVSHRDATLLIHIVVVRNDQFVGHEICTMQSAYLILI